MSNGNKITSTETAVADHPAESGRDSQAEQALCAFWRDALSGAPALIEWPGDRPRPSQQDFVSASIEVRIDASLRGRLESLARNCGGDLQTVLLAAWTALLGRLSDQQDVVIGHPPSGRGGMAVSTDPLPLRIDLSGDPDAARLVERTHAQRQRAAMHSDLGLAQIIDALKPEQSRRHAPLFQTVMSWREDRSADACVSSRLELPSGRVQYDMHLDLGDRANDRGELEIFGALAYAPALFERTSAERIAGYWQRLLRGMTMAEGRPIASLPILSDAERSELLDIRHLTAREYPRDLGVHQLFEAQVARVPDAVAVMYDDRTLTYAELDRRAERLAHRLRAAGVVEGDRVAICASRHLGMLVAVLGVLKSGAAYVPLDTAFPRDRLVQIIEDSLPVLALIDAEGEGVLDRGSETAVADLQRMSLPIDGDFDDEDDISSMKSAEMRDAPSRSTPDTLLAYILFTSGSTGRPKGVCVPHRAVVNFLLSMADEPGLDANDVFCAVTTISFDISVLELLLPLSVGACIALVDRRTAADGEALAATIERFGATAMQATPATWRMLLDAGWRPTARMRLLCGGEAWHMDLGERLLADGAELWNMYGPTETTVWSMIERVVAGQSRIMLGRPIANTQIYILDAYQEPVPAGVAGELYIGGDGVTLGYYGREDLTSERFVADPYAGRSDARMYKTGDLVRRLPSGAIEFIGRNDFQVKIRGFRIELGEIESRLSACEGVREAVVLAREDVPGEKQLVAYYLSDARLPIESLRDALGVHLPSYMVPSAYVRMQAWPLTPNGKLDRRALPAPDDDAYVRREYEAPQNETEIALATIWQNLLRIDRVGRQDHFFELGGHSLLAVQMMSRVRQALGVELMQHELFDAPVLAQLALRIDRAERSELSAIEPVPRETLMPLSLAQRRLWVLTQIDTASSAYHIYGALRLQGRLDTAALDRAIRAMIARHEALRTRFVLADGEPMQTIDLDPEFALGAIDLRDVYNDRDASDNGDADQRYGDERAFAARERACAKAGATLFAAPFDLRRDVPFRAQLVRLDDEAHELQLTVHHIVADGWSMGLIYEEIGRLYAGEVENAPTEALFDLPALPIQYVDYAAWQRQWLSGERHDAQVAFWRKALTGAPPLLEMPTDRPRPAQQDFTGASVAIRVEPELTAQLKTLARKHGATLYMTLLGSWALTLGRLANQDDVVVGSPVAGRQRVEIEALIGFFVNTLALRIDLSGAPTVAELLTQVRRHVLDAQAHQDLPFDRVVEAVNPPRNTGHTPIYQAILALQNQEETLIEMPGIAATEIVPDTTSVQCDLLLDVAERDGAIVGKLEYATALFDADTAVRVRDCWLRLLRAMVEESERPVSELTMLDDRERRRVLENWNDTAREFPRDGRVHEIFEAQAERTPNATALVGEGVTLDYAELNRRANRIAHRLIAIGVRPDDRVAICMERSIEMVIGFLAILKAGAGYVPIDPSYPRERRAYLLADSAPAAILTTEALRDADWLVETGAPILVGDIETAEGRDDNPQVDGLTGRSLAYVIYTSGSTGEPKGVLVEHRNILRLTINNTFAPLDAGDCIAHLA
ncbi:MAG: amino acid adenylation domain-containing protein, partial [Xanthomonadaceae bacterium]|nr:amino acid adenylation domain-containing protein [Xanthomonadaceae bacterium]